MERFKDRRKKLLAAVARSGIDLLVLGGRGRMDANSFYYCGDSAFPVFLTASADGATIYSSQQPVFFSGADAKPLSSFGKDLKKLLGNKKTKTVGIDKRSDLSAGLLLELLKKEKKPVDFTNQLLGLRLVKDSFELACIEKAQEITLESLEEVSRKVRTDSIAGETENYLAGLCESRARELGASLDAFPPIILSGPRTSVFHEATSNRRICHDDVLLVDAGARFN